MKNRIGQNIYRLCLVIVFIAFFIAGFFRVSELVRRKLNEDIDMIHSFYSLEKNSLDTIVIGSSHAYYGVTPNILWEENGITSYVMASPAQTPALSYYLLKEVMKYQKPKVVLYETYGCTYNDYFSDEGILRNVTDSMKLSKNKIDMINTLCSDLSFEDRMPYYLPLIKYHDRWRRLKNFDFHADSTYLKGTKATLETRHYNPNRNLECDPKPLWEGSQEYLDKIVQYCEDNDIELVFIATPVCDYREKKWLNYYSKNLTIEKYAKEHDIPFWFYDKMDVVNKVDYYTDFVDYGHMNSYGQAVYTKELGLNLKNQYGMTGHKGDPAYKTWDEDLEKYKENIADLEEKAKDGSNIKELKEEANMEQQDDE